MKQISGINLLVYKPKGNKKYCNDDITKFLKKYKLNEALRLIGELSYNILRNNNANPVINLHGVPVSDSLLAYLTMNIIECSNDYRKEILSTNDIAKIADMYYGLPDPFVEDANLDEFLLRFGSAQFDYDREINNIVPRTFLIYCRLWNDVEKANEIDINAAVQKITKLNIDNLIVFAYAFLGACIKGFFRLYDENKISIEKDKPLFTEEKQRSFIDWISCSYQEFRIESLKIKNELPSKDFEKNRFNLLIKHPIIKPDRNPRPDLKQVYLVPITRLLLERVTHGLYFDLSDFFQKPGKSNKFREAFGHVFQEYVGYIIKQSHCDINLLNEWRYYRDQKSTVDWIIIEGNKAVFIEVKQTGLFLQAKTLGNTKDVQENLTKSISKAAQQLWLFEQDIKSGKHKELADLSNIEEIERLVVTYDRTYYSNSILKKYAHDIAIQGIQNFPEQYDWHIISIEELEHILAINNISLFNFLRTKRNDEESREWDFREYIARKYPQPIYINPYLENVKKEFLNYVNNTID